jgi:hypothetical protein
MWFGIISLILLFVLYFVATSAAFLRSVILPRVGKSMNSTITVGDASISPFSQVVLKDLKVTPNGKETLLTAQELRARYSLFKIIGGNIKVDEVAIVAPVVQIVTAADGSSNLDPILASQKKDETPEKDEGKSEAPKVDLKKFALNNATVRNVQHHANGKSDTIEISNVNVTLDDLRNGATAKLAVGAHINMANNPPDAQPGSLAGTLNGNWTIAFSPELKPAAVQGAGQFNVQNSSGALAELAGFSAQFNTDTTPTEIKQVALQFKKGNTALGEVRVHGPFDINKMEGLINVVVGGIDRQVLNLAGASSGMDFGSTVINSTNQIQFANAGNAITAQGQVAVAKLSIRREAQTTPPMDVQLAYNVAVNNADKAADIRAFTLNGVQGGQSVLKSELTSPMRISWGGANANAGDSTLRLIVDGLNLADWKALAADLDPAGKVNMTVNLQSQQSGKQLALDATSQIEGLAMTSGSNRLQNIGITLRARGQAVDMKKITLPELRVETTHAGQPMLTLSGNAQTDTDAKTTDAQFTLDGALPTILKALSRADASATSGALNGQLKVTQKGDDQSVNGKIALASFNGQYGDKKFSNFGLNADIDAGQKGNELELRKFSGALTGAGKPAGTFEVSGKLNQAKQAGQFQLKLANINEGAVRPFLEPMFPGKQLVSVSINGDASANMTGFEDSKIKADFKVANLALRDPKKANPQAPLAVGFKLEAAQKNKVVELQNCEVALTPTQRAKNVVKITGRLDQSQTDAMQGDLKVNAETLDVTPYYDLVAGDKAPDAPASSSTPSAQPAASPGEANKEPDPIKLPFRNTVADIQIARLFLREIDIANFRSTTKVDGSLVTMKPLEMSINGGPVDASVDLDLGSPGYKYDVVFKANRVPAEPLANSFSPDYKGRVKGELLADIGIKGAGTKGVNLKKTLVGNVGLTVTNANIQLVGPRSKTFLGSLNVVLTAVGVALGMPDLSKSPVNFLTSSVKLGEGKINLAELTVISEAFIAESRGIIPIADVLENSPLNRIPVEISLSYPVAARARVLPANASTNDAYVKLPTLAHVRGTIGDVKTDIDKTAIVGLLARSAGGIPGVAGGDAGKLLQGIGGFLSGDRNTNRAAANTNAPGGTATNAPTATTNAPAQRNPLGGLLDLIPKKKK